MKQRIISKHKYNDINNEISLLLSTNCNHINNIMINYVIASLINDEVDEFIVDRGAEFLDKNNFTNYLIH